MKSRASVLTLVLMLASCGGRRLPAPIARIAAAQLPRFEHVVLIVEENQNYANVIGNTQDMPYLNTLAAKYGLATNYFANTHPSINNYFLLTAGQIGISAPWIFRDASDLYPFTIPGENIASILSDHGKTWKSYAENLPTRGYVGRDRWPYVKRHDPFAYFATVRASPLQRKNIVPFEEFERDLRNDSLPNYAFIAANVYNDGHHDPVTRHPARAETTAPCSMRMAG